LNIDLVSDNRHFFGIAKLIKKVLESKLNPFNINSRNEPISFTSSTDINYSGAEQDVTASVIFEDAKIEPHSQYEVRVYHRGEYVGGNNSKKLRKNIFN